MALSHREGAAVLSCALMVGMTLEEGWRCCVYTVVQHRHLLLKSQLLVLLEGRQDSYTFEMKSVYVLHLVHAFVC